MSVDSEIRELRLRIEKLEEALQAANNGLMVNEGVHLTYYLDSLLGLDEAELAEITSTIEGVVGVV